MSSTAAFLSDALATRCEPSASDSVSFDVGGIPVSTNIREFYWHSTFISFISVFVYKLYLLKYVYVMDRVPYLQYP